MATEVMSSTVRRDLDRIKLENLWTFLDKVRQHLEHLEKSWRQVIMAMEEQLVKYDIKLDRIAWLCRLLEYLALLILSALRFLLSGDKFGGFQNRERPKCTTMPWNIWPSLVVLWGVCWMFVNTPVFEFDATQFSSFLDEQLLEFDPSLSLDPSFTSILGGFGLALAPFDFGNVSNDEAYSYASYLNLQDMNGTSLESCVQKRQDQSSSRAIVDSLTYSGSPTGNSTSNPENGITNLATQDFPIRQLSMDVSQAADTHVNDHPLPFPPPSAPASHSQHSGVPLQQQAGNIPKQQETPPRDKYGNLICTDPGCNDKIFKRRSDWETHVNKHRRPFRCSVEGCRGSAGFATKGVLDRHVFRLHQRSRLASSGIERPIEVDVARKLPETMAASFVVSDHGKRKRSTDRIRGREKNENGLQAASPKTKRTKLIVQDSDEAERTMPNMDDTIKENESLKQQIRVMVGIIDRLTKRGNEDVAGDLK